jgi:hypothetical protein
MTPSQFSDVTNQGEAEGEQETAQEQNATDPTANSKLSPRRLKSKRPNEQSPSSLQKETEEDDPIQSEKPPMSPTTGEEEEDAVPTSTCKKKKPTWIGLYNTTNENSAPPRTTTQLRWRDAGNFGRHLTSHSPTKSWPSPLELPHTEKHKTQDEIDGAEKHTDIPTAHEKADVLLSGIDDFGKDGKWVSEGENRF